jgi:pimeloyl-ACP methyl ester carboxylesterase
MTPYLFPDYQVAGAGDTTVFLLHGAYGAKDYFRYEIQALVQQGLRVVAWDAPGYGISPLPAHLSIEGLAEAAARLIQAVGTGTNILVGHSMGGIVAPAVCGRIPDRVHGLVISATVASFSQKTDEEKAIFLEERIAPLNRGKSFRETAGAVVDSMFAPGSQGPKVDLVKEVALSTSKETFIAAISAIVNYEGVPALRAVRCPTLLLAGAHDKVGKPEAMAKMVDFIPHAGYARIEGAGHYAFAEQQDVFNQHLLAFISAVRSESPAVNA